MKGKYMKIKRVVLSTLTVVMIASQLCGCAAVSKDELEEMISETETVTIETAEPLIVGERETREDSEPTEAETESETVTSAKTIEDLVKEAAKVSDFTEEELESIVEDARVYEAYGSSPEQAVNMALADAVNGKTNGSVDMTFTLPVVVDENGVPYPTDPSNGQPIIPETEEPAKESESVNSTMENVAQESENVNKKDLPVTIESDDDGYGNKVVVRGKWEVVEVTTPDGVTHTLHSEDEYMQFLVQWEFEHDEEQQQYIASEDRFKDIGTYNGLAYSSGEEFLEAERNSTVHGKVQ